MRAIPLLAAALLLAACAGSSSSDSPNAGSSSSDSPTAGSPTAAPSPATGLPDDAVITYAFRDSSVPPQYHRSVTLTVAKPESRIVIDSYGDVLADTAVATPDEVWVELGATIPSLAGLTVTNSEEGCTGGTSIEVTVMSGAQTLLSLSPEFCAGANEDLEAPIAAWIAPARDLFPPTSELAPEGE